MEKSPVLQLLLHLLNGYLLSIYSARGTKGVSTLGQPVPFLSMDIYLALSLLHHASEIKITNTF